MLPLASRVLITLFCVVGRSVFQSIQSVLFLVTVILRIWRLAQLKRENARLKEDNEILKKAVGIFPIRPS